MHDIVAMSESHDEGTAFFGETGPGPRPGKPLDPANLTVIQEGIAMVEMADLIRRQPVCAVLQGQSPRIVFHEVYTSMEALRQSLTPNVNLHANPWLFQALTRFLDGRTIEHLTEHDELEVHSSFSVNLNVSTLLSPEFLEFGENTSEKMRGSIIIELQLVDVYSDLGNFFYARNVLRERGFKFCLDGITHLALPLIDREALGFDLVKLLWHSGLQDQLTGAGGAQVREAAEKTGPDRIILARCDSEQALEAGRSMGIALYQGRLIDGLCERPTAYGDTFGDLGSRRAAVA